MQDLIKQILAYLPNYLANFGAMVASPKRFINGLNFTAEDSFRQSLIHLAISGVIGIILLAPTLPPGVDLWSRLAILTVLSVVSVGLLAVTVHLAWRLVGGSAGLRTAFVIYAYFFGSAIVFIIMVRLFAVGFFRCFDPLLYSQLIAAAQQHRAAPSTAHSRILAFAYLIMMIGYVVLWAWGLRAWGALRQLNNVSVMRSVTAYLMVFCASWVIGLAVYILGIGLQTPT